MRNFTLILLSFILFSCGSDDSDTMNPEPTPLMAVETELIFFTFTPDTGNNSFRLQYDIEFTNPNPTNINGFYQVTTNADGLVSTLLSTDNSPCYDIAANTTCTFSFDGEDSFDIAMIDAITFISAEYSIDEGEN